MVLFSENSKRRGEIAEAHIIARLLEVGYNVLKPMGDNARYDLVIEDDEGRFWKVQCKLGWMAKQYGKGIIFATASSYAHTRAGQKAGYGRRSYVGEIDYFAAYCKETKGVYLVPMQDANGTQVKLALEEPKGKNQHKVHMAADYEI